MKPSISSIPALRAMVLHMGQQALDAQVQKPRCAHRILGECVGHWDTSGTKVLPFDIHNCQACGTTKSVRLWQAPQLA